MCSCDENGSITLPASTGDQPQDPGGTAALPRGEYAAIELKGQTCGGGVGRGGLRLVRGVVLCAPLNCSVFLLSPLVPPQTSVGRG